jgi:hypothetical protein
MDKQVIPGLRYLRTKEEMAFIAERPKLAEAYKAQIYAFLKEKFPEEDLTTRGTDVLLQELERHKATMLQISSSWNQGSLESIEERQQLIDIVSEGWIVLRLVGKDGRGMNLPGPS